jgi:O-antigen/teichoic acid export membrane protein
VYESEFLPAYPVLLVLLIGFGFANIFFWNRPLLLAQGLANFPLKVGFWAMVAKVSLAFVLLPWAGYMTEAAAFGLFCRFGGYHGMARAARG